MVDYPLFDRTLASPDRAQPGCRRRTKRLYGVGEELRSAGILVARPVASRRSRRRWSRWHEFGSAAVLTGVKVVRSGGRSALNAPAEMARSNEGPRH
jgi:hypothetical protein